MQMLERQKVKAMLLSGNCDWDLELPLLISETGLLSQKADRKLKRRKEES